MLTLGRRIDSSIKHLSQARGHKPSLYTVSFHHKTYLMDTHSRPTSGTSVYISKVYPVLPVCNHTVGNVVTSLRKIIIHIWTLHLVFLINSLRLSDAYICVSKLTIISADGRRQAIIWNNAGILSIGPLGTNFNEIFNLNSYIFIQQWRPFCLSFNVLNIPSECLPGQINPLEVWLADSPDTVTPVWNSPDSPDPAITDATSLRGYPCGIAAITFWLFYDFVSDWRWHWHCTCFIATSELLRSIRSKPDPSLAWRIWLAETLTYAPLCHKHHFTILSRTTPILAIESLHLSYFIPYHQ